MFIVQDSGFRVYVREPQQLIPRCVHCIGFSAEGIGLRLEDSGLRAFAREPRQLPPRCKYCTVRGSGFSFRVWIFAFRCLRFGFRGPVCGIQDSEFRIWFQVSGFGLRADDSHPVVSTVQGSGFSATLGRSQDVCRRNPVHPSKANGA